ncbi:hypothetical protein ACOTJF_28410 [Achromobacter ruhlandii]|uniref:hypothetical protein n=1 Tax=Achromobacter ruhlandii TaxID=72557 RepID=UPI003BA01AB2
MKTIDDGGTAFPVPNFIRTYGPGMTQRTYFAAKAMAVVTPPRDLCGTAETAREYANWAEKCWRMADAMLAARGAQ